MASFQAGLGHVTDEKADLGQLIVKHYRDLDGLRGILALCVVLMHFGFNNYIYRHTGFPGFAFSLCVDAFFLLSGFVLTASYRPDKSFKTFALKRFFRLGPVFYATTLVALAVTPDLNPRLAPLELAMAVPFAGKYPANFPAWSITWEFYLPIAACAIGRRLPQIPAIAGFCISLFLLAISDMGVPISPGFYYFERAACGLAAGHYLFRLYRPWGSPRITIACVAGLFGLFFVAEITPIFGKLVPLVAALAIWSGATAESRLLSCRLARWLGAISYTVYMVHMPVLNAMLAISIAVNANPGAKVFALMVSIIFAGVLTRFVEKPMMALGGKIAART